MIDVINNKTTGEKIWEITIAREKLYNNVSLRSDYINDRLPPEERSDSLVLLDDDRALYEKYLTGAIADLNMMLSYFSRTEFSDYDIDSENIYMNLSLTPNHKDSIAYSLNEYIVSFLELNILNRWYGKVISNKLGIDAELAEADINLRRAINYRKKPVRLPIDPLM